jgi:4-diphosphocytidyl-2-C-methyl-D-erythritol kinase
VADVLAAPAKLTRSLRVTGVRDDGLHLIEAEMVTIDLADELAFDEGDGLELVGAGPDVPVGDRNLVSRALAAVERRAQVRVAKRIPSGAGLGGGSADAAAVLRWAGCDDLAVAVRLGSDVPFCLVGGRAVVRGVGAEVEPLEHLDLTFTLVTPPVHCSTAAVYRAWDELGGPTGPGANDLEPAALAVAPELGGWRDRLQEASGQVPVLAGSGSTWFVEGAHPGEGHVIVRTVPAGWAGPTRRSPSPTRPAG